MSKFGNTANKVRAVLSVMREGEKLKVQEIAARLRSTGYRVQEGQLSMFIYYYMLYKHVQRERANGVNYYFI